MSKRVIQVFQPMLGEDELAAISKVFERNWPGRGQEVDSLEEEFARFLGVNRKHVLTTNSCTEAMFQILNLVAKAGDEVILPTISFVGAANAIVGQGMKAVFCDVDSKTGNATLERIKAVLTPKTKAILIQHFGGLPAEIHKIASWASEREIVLIEDAAGAMGSVYQDQPCGTFGDFGVWSLDAMKMVVAGDGGVIFAKSTEKAAALRERMYMGLSNVSGASSAGQQKRWWEFDVSYPGRRSIMNDISAAIARVQLRKLNENLKIRKRNAELYFKLLKDVPSIGMPLEDFTDNLSHYFFPVSVPASKRDGLAEYLNDHGIYTTFRYFPLNRVPLYGAQNLEFLNSDEFAATTLLLPQHVGLVIEDVEFVAGVVVQAMSGGIQ